jgi:hypothetical protein
MRYIFTLLSILVLCDLHADVPALQSGDRWCVLGDSITKGGVSGKNETWFMQLKKNYWTYKETKGDLRREVDAAVPAALQAAQPKPHHFEIKAVKSPSMFQENAI